MNTISLPVGAGSIQAEYLARTSSAKRKQLGQYFTPKSIAEFMVRWVLEKRRPKNFLDPATGLGIFPAVLAELYRQPIEVTACDIDQEIIPYAKRSLAHANCLIQFKNANYLELQEDKYDAIVCNPPYLKHHNVENKIQTARAIGGMTGLTLPNTLNAYCLFLLKSMNELAPGGRLAYIVPSEFLSADYGVEVKRYLLDSGKLRKIVYFDSSLSVFDEALTTAAILFIENSAPSRQIELCWVKTDKELSELRAGVVPTVQSIAIEKISPDAKWQNYFTGASAVADEYERDFVPLSTYGRCKRGIATGANAYFVLTELEAKSLGLEDSDLRPCMLKAFPSRANTFDDNDFEALRKAGKKCFLFDPVNPLSDSAAAYVEEGVRRGISKRYLPAHRTPWYAAEQRPPADFWVPVFFRERWSVIDNKCEMLNATTYHGFYLNEAGREVRALLHYYMNSALFQKLMATQTRRYGAGLNKVEPNDVQKILAPNFKLMTPKARVALLRELRSGATADGIWRLI